VNTRSKTRHLLARRSQINRLSADRAPSSPRPPVTRACGDTPFHRGATPFPQVLPNCSQLVGRGACQSWWPF